MPDATPETACGLITRFLDDHDAVAKLLRDHGPLRCHGFTLRYRPSGQILVLACEFVDAMHASELDGPADFRVADAVTNPDDLPAMAEAWDTDRPGAEAVWE